MTTTENGAAAAAERWWPSPFGADDELWMLNHVDDGKRLEALALVRRGRMYDLGRVLDEHVPVFPGRFFRQTLVTTAHHANPDGGVGDNGVNWITEQVTATQQLGTHLDALSHLQSGDRGYNGWTVADLAGTAGVRRLGVEGVPQILTRGWLVDVPARRGVERLEPGDVVGVEDLAGVEPTPGDAVLFHTGWGARWDDAEGYLGGEPGPGCAVAHWLAERGVALTGCDTWSFGPVPPEDPARPFEVPQTLNVHYGIVVAENLALGDLAAAGASQFMFVLSHARLRGATGAWVAPLAII